MLSISEVSIYSWFGWQRAPLAGWCGQTPLLADGWTPLTDWSAGQHVTQKHSGYWPDRMRLRLMVKPDVLKTTGHYRGTQAMPSLCPQSGISATTP